MPTFTKRKHQVENEGINPIPEKDYFPSRLVIHEHDADKAGKHFDIRLDIGGKAVSFATRKGLPEQGKPVALFRQPDHVQSYMDWEGSIEKGEYGAGEVRIATKSPTVIKSSNDKIQFTIAKGDNKGTYALLRKDDNNWLAVKKNPMENYWAPRPKYTEPNEVPWADEEYETLEKLDGAHFLAKVHPNGISFTSQRKSVNGEIIDRTDQVPHLRDQKLPKKFHDLVVRSELWHDKGFNVASGTLNSKPENAVAKQQREGWMRMAPLYIEKGPKGEENLPYNEQLELLKEMVGHLPSHSELPRRPEGDAKAFFDMIAREGGEGVVLTKRDKSVRLKHKARLDYDLKVKDFTDGTGRLANAGIGALVLEDKNGKEVGKVGTGLTDVLRKHIYHNQDIYKGRLVKVRSRKPLKGKLREPSFLGWTTDKNEPDEVS